MSTDDINKGIKLSSTWNGLPTEFPTNVIVNSSLITDEQLGETNPLIFTTSDSSRCELQFEFDPPHLFKQLQLFSNTRTCELYVNDEYDGTSKGTPYTLDQLQLFKHRFDISLPTKTNRVKLRFFGPSDKTRVSLFQIRVSSAPMSANQVQMQKQKDESTTAKEMMMMMNLLSSMSSAVGTGSPLKDMIKQSLPPMPLPMEPTRPSPPKVENDTKEAPTSDRTSNSSTILRENHAKQQLTEERVQEMINDAVSALEARIQERIDSAVQKLQKDIQLLLSP